jgi:hypothetical protein
VTKRVRIGSVVGVLALTIAMLPLFAGAASANPVTGAGFTTTNTSVDETGHCKNGNEDINCNIYDGKEFVWLNGGPSVAYVGDGDYFFAVLVPGGQQDPNDGAANNLSDISPTSNTGAGDAYTNRTFSVSGGVVSYNGSHEFANNKIRLMPYDDTTNPGGVYIMAICSLGELGDAYPVDASECKYDAFKIQEDETPPASDLVITKDANGSFDNKYVWSIKKKACQQGTGTYSVPCVTTVRKVGGTATFDYKVTVTHDGGTIDNVKVTGTIAVFNPNKATVDYTSITDTLSDDTICAVNTGNDEADGSGSASFDPTGDSIPAESSAYFPYVCSLTAPQADLRNKATVEWDTQFLDNGATLDGSSASVWFPTAEDEYISFTENAIDECVDVSDVFNGGAADQSHTFCVGDTGQVDNGDGTFSFSFTYSRTVPIPAYGCVSYDNTATFTTNDTQKTGSDSQTVTVCGPAKTGALTIGFWKTTNGQNLIKTYCQNPTLANYLKGLGTGSGPFSDAPITSCNNLATYVQGILNGASATNMNNMLKAQMLGTALDVWFSGPGWTSVKSGNIKPPSNFLTHNNLGTFKMDTTAVCPMVDNTSTGSATCLNNTPSTDAVASGAVPSSPMSIQAILDHAATTPSPFNGSTSPSIWYGGDRTKQEILKNIFDQFNNEKAFGSF